MLAIHGGTPVRTEPFPGWTVHTEQDRKALQDFIRSGRYHTDTERKRFEETFARDEGVRHVFAVANGTVSLELILRSFGIGPGDEVILPPYTFIATLSSVLYTGAKPVFADIDPGTYNLDPADAERKISPRTKAVVAVAVGGCPPDVDALQEVCRRHGIRLILDAAQAAGASWKGQSLCALGDACSISCQNSKNLTCGEGGIIATDGDALASELELRLGGGMRDGQYVRAAQDHRLSSVQSVILMSQYGKFRAEFEKREDNAAYLDLLIREFPFVSPQVRDPRISGHGYHLYILRFHEEALRERGLDRDRFCAAVQAEGIPLCPGYAPLYRFPCCASESTKALLGPGAGEIDCTPLPQSERAGYREGTWMYQSLLLGTHTDMEQIAQALDKVWRHADEV